MIESSLNCNSPQINFAYDHQNIDLYLRFFFTAILTVEVRKYMRRCDLLSVWYHHPCQASFSLLYSFDYLCCKYHWIMCHKYDFFFIDQLKHFNTQCSQRNLTLLFIGADKLNVLLLKHFHFHSGTNTLGNRTCRNKHFSNGFLVELWGNFNISHYNGKEGNDIPRK